MDLIVGILKLAGNLPHINHFIMKKFNTESLDDLEKGIKQLLLEDRCSFSENEINLLNDCILVLQAFKSVNEKTGKPDLAVIPKVIDAILKIVRISDHLQDLF
jgi:hypothetical protein